jgi:hypothetical protein
VLELISSKGLNSRIFLTDNVKAISHCLNIKTFTSISKIKKAKQGIGHSQRSALNVFFSFLKKCPSGLIELQLPDCPIQDCFLFSFSFFKHLSILTTYSYHDYILRMIHINNFAKLEACF